MQFRNSKKAEKIMQIFFLIIAGIFFLFFIFCLFNGMGELAFTFVLMIPMGLFFGIAKRNTQTRRVFSKT